MNVARHWRFLGGLGVGVLAALLVPLAGMQRLLAGIDTLFVFFLLTTWMAARHHTPATLRRTAQIEDEGGGVILLLALAAIGASMIAVFDALSAEGASAVQRYAPLASVPLGWLTLHTLFAFRYAHVWYASAAGDGRTEGDDAAAAARGLDFGDDVDEPGLTEFFYYSFTIGMTFQTSDVSLRASRMRRLTLGHAVLSFFYNTVLIAVSVNAALGGG